MRQLFSPLPLVSRQSVHLHLVWRSSCEMLHVPRRLTLQQLASGILAVFTACFHTLSVPPNECWPSVLHVARPSPSLSLISFDPSFLKEMYPFHASPDSCRPVAERAVLNPTFLVAFVLCFCLPRVTVSCASANSSLPSLDLRRLKLVHLRHPLPKLPLELVCLLAAAGLPLIFLDAPKFQQLLWWYPLFPGVAGCLWLFVVVRAQQCLSSAIVLISAARFRMQTHRDSSVRDGLFP